MTETVKIRTAEDLKQLSNRVNCASPKDSVYKINAILMNDLDLTEYNKKGGRVSWKPIGHFTSKFSGEFDGQGHTIKGLYIDLNSRCNDPVTSNFISFNYGLFGYVYKGCVKNLTVEGLIENKNLAKEFVSNSNLVAGIVGVLEESKMVNCINRVDINLMRWKKEYDRQSKRYVTKIDANECWNNPIGGICGCIGNPFRSSKPFTGSNNTGCLLENCINYGTLKGQNPHGIAAIYNYRSIQGLFKNCCNEGELWPQNIDFLEAVLKNNNKYDQIGGMIMCDGSSRQEGKVMLPFQNSIIGLCCKNYRFMSAPFMSAHQVNKHDIVNCFLNMLVHDPNTEYVNENGDTYLHLICQNDSLIHNAYNYDPTWAEKDVTLPEVIKLMAQHTDIDFGAENKTGKEAVTFLKKHRNIPDIEEAIAIIQEVKKEQAELENDYQDSFSEIGW